MTKKRKVPLRICLGCQEKLPKKELIRIVRTPEGSVTVDRTGKKAGRGAYICPSESCLKNAVKGKRLERNLQTAISEQVLENIREELDPERQE